MLGCGESGSEAPVRKSNLMPLSRMKEAMTGTDGGDRMDGIEVPIADGWRALLLVIGS